MIICDIMFTFPEMKISVDISCKLSPVPCDQMLFPGYKRRQIFQNIACGDLYIYIAAQKYLMYTVLEKSTNQMYSLLY